MPLNKEYSHTHTHKHIHGERACVCVCVCVCDISLLIGEESAEDAVGVFFSPSVWSFHKYAHPKHFSKNFFWLRFAKLMESVRSENVLLVPIFFYLAVNKLITDKTQNGIF